MNADLSLLPVWCESDLKRTGRKQNECLCVTSDTNSYKQIVVGTQLMSRKEGFAGEDRTKNFLLYLEAFLHLQTLLLLTPYQSQGLNLVLRTFTIVYLQNVRKGPLPTHSMLSLDTISQ